ncbi:MAG: hypothetical protein HY851_01995 [candidate division Zixibacteria bacterium]|nr:hypothetical protein [candidate division Zixibacteria bacterium]
MKRHLPNLVLPSKFIGLVVCCGALALVLNLSSPVQAQTKPRPRTVVLDPMTQELADEYADILEQLRNIISDYSDYLRELGDKDLIAATSFETFNRALAKGTYADSSTILAKDLSAYRAKVASLENECEKTSAARSAKSCRVVRSLSREIRSLSDQLSSYRSHLEEEGQSEEELQRKIKQITAISQEMAKQYSEIARRALEKAGKELEQNELTLPKAPQGGSDVPRPPGKPSGRAPRSHRSDHGDEVGTKRTSNGVMSVSSMSIPVVISNPNGSVELTGTSGKSISASLEFEVAAGSLSREREIADGVGLKLANETGRYLVEASAPQLSDPKTRILRNALVVSVPAGLRVECRGAYGDQTISDLTGPLRVSAQYATVDISNCTAGVDVSNSMGSVTLSDITGIVRATNSYGDIEISDCRGDLQITNAFSGIDLSGCRGKVNIHNSGATSVSDQVGPVSINNQYGEVSITNVQGDVEIHNAYKAVTVENVTGRTFIENNYSPIRVVSLRGRTKLINQYALISGEDIRGPLDIVGQGGAIELSLTEPLSGPSSINSTYGPVRLEVLRSLDLIITARTSFGEISGSLPFTVQSEGSSRSGVVRLGRARDSLSIIGINASIELSGSR